VKSIDSGFQTSLNADVTNLARLWELLLSNGTEYRFTDHDRDITHDGNIFLAAPGIRISAIRSVTGGGTQNATIEIACATGFITMDTVRRGGLRGATFNVYLVNWKTPTHPSVNLFRGRVSTSHVTDRGKAECEVRGLLGGAQKALGEIYQQQCRADQGDERCTFDRDSTDATFTVTAVASNQMSFTTDVVVAASHWEFGEVEWTTGDNANAMMDIRSSDNAGGVSLQLPMAYDIQVGDTGTLRQGCDKNRSTCVTKFNNLLNFRGEPDSTGTLTAAGAGGGATPPTQQNPGGTGFNITQYPQARL
jgi:uncharacterized phage protein (TIGR02218 family)